MKGRLKLSYVSTLCLAFILAVSLPLMTSAEMIEEWVARYNGSADGNDQAYAIAVDASGNVYVTGGSEDDYATIKYDTNGNQLWVKRDRGYGNAIAVDASRNVYVTGWSVDSGTYSYTDYATVKYDTDGNELWVKRYNGPGNSYDGASAIAVDALGNVYVTGLSGSYPDYDYVTVKYDSEGNELWVRRYNGPADGDDRAKAMAVDTSGSVYVTGSSGGVGTSSDYATVKYDTDGNELWVARYNGPGNDYDWADAIAVDSSGNVYVTGDSTGSGTWDDYATVKYDTNGNELWVKRYNGPGNDYDWANAIAIDALGNVYVTGWSSDSGTDDDYATIKYDTNGNQLWVKRYNGPANGDDGYSEMAMAVDASGNVYVTGRSEGSGTEYDYATVKYDTDGNQLWVKRYNGPGNHDDEANAIAIDASGNVYVTGGSWGSETWEDYATVKYDTNGNELWVKRYNGPGNHDDEAHAIAVDTSGNVYVTGWSEASGTGGDYATIKYDTHGNQLWVKRYNGPGDDDDEAHAIAIDASGSVYVTGSSEGSGTGDDYATVKYDTDGNQLWVKRYNGPRNHDDGANAIAVDTLGNVYVTGESLGSGTSSDYTTVKYDTNGNDIWVARYNGPGNGWDEANAIAVDAMGNVYVTGYSFGSGTEYDYATVKYDTDGNQLWVARYNGPGDDDDEANAIAVDASGNVYVTGESCGSGTEYDYATVKYDANGNELWVARYNGPVNGEDYAYAIAVDPSRNVYVTGRSWGGDWSTGGTYDDYATVKYDTNGNQLWVARYNGPGNMHDVDVARAIAVDALGSAYVTGRSRGSGTDYDYATVKYDTHGNQLWVKRYKGPGNGRDEANAIAVDVSGNVYVTGGSGSGPDDDYATVKYGEGLPAGWSMMSLPVRPEVPTVANVFPQAVVVYKYQKGTGYVRVKVGENLEVGVGYWILLNKPRPYITEGTEITEYTLPVTNGWHMIGGCSMPANKTVTNGKIVVIYGYAQGKGYTRVPGSQLLQRGKGYWILFSNTSEGAEFTASTSVAK